MHPAYFPASACVFMYSVFPFHKNVGTGACACSHTHTHTHTYTHSRTHVLGARMLEPRFMPRPLPPARARVSARAAAHADPARVQRRSTYTRTHSRTHIHMHTHAFFFCISLHALYSVYALHSYALIYAFHVYMLPLFPTGSSALATPQRCHPLTRPVPGPMAQVPLANAGAACPQRRRVDAEMARCRMLRARTPCRILGGRCRGAPRGAPSRARRGGPSMW